MAGGWREGGCLSCPFPQGLLLGDWGGGLLLSEMPETVKGMLQNFLDLVRL